MTVERGWVKFMNYLQNFRWEKTGQARAGRLVFLHGLMGAGINWRRIVTSFTDDFEVLTFDQRGHGESFHPPLEGDTGYRPEDYAEDLLRIIDELGWEQIHLVGHSLGGRNALCFAAQHPNRVTKLVLEDIGPESSLEGAQVIERLMQLVPTPFATKKAARQFFLNDYAKLISFHPQPQVISQFFYTNIVEKPDGTADWRFHRDGIMASLMQGRMVDRWDQYRSLTMPTLVMRGERSTDLSRPVYERMLQELPSAKGAEIADAGHWIHFDQPQAFVAELRKFLL